ncbi:DUF1552 domain-containing protein [Bremerella sp.]|uniref:DUF1552 domain-containing protein n=1 Tax=Bremerella sp. TaxID=2795602 RepID=UPI00391BBA7A
MNLSIPSRRTFLRSAGVTLALPILDSLATSSVSAAQPTWNSDGVPRRMVCICNNLGLHLPYFIPEGTGRGWKPSPYLRELNAFRNQMTVFSGVSHPEVDGGHPAQKSFLTCAPHPGGNSFKNTISLDQYAADFIGRETRYPFLALCANGNDTLSWTRAGVPIPGATRPSQVFAKLFLTGNSSTIAAQIRRLRHGESIMDTVLQQARSLEKRLNGEDRAKFDEYVTSVREVEQQLVRQQEWEKKPKPHVDAKPPKDIAGQADVIGRADLMFDLTSLALQTDSTRLVTIMMEGFFIVPPIDGVEEGYHTVSHHGQNARKLKQLAIIETEHIKALRRLLGKLDQTSEQGDTLLDRTMVLYGSNMGNASSHDNRNLPVILAGGGFKHGQHLAFDQSNNYPLPNLFVSMLQRLGIETDTFASSTGTMRGLEFA